MKTKIEIKNIFGKLLFEFECENNTIKKTVEKAIENSADLRYANLQSANLRYVDLSYANLQSANLRYVDLRSANLRYVDLRSANLYYANLQSADLQSADLRSANLRSANLRYANLQSANLQYADLRSAYLSSADLRSANLSSADLSHADLSYADLSYADQNAGTLFLSIACPEEGSFIAYKKASGKIIKLMITEDAKRSSATTLKCRASKAQTISIENIDGTPYDQNFVSSDYDSSFIYRIGEVVEVTTFDEDRWNECAPGIHFFLSKELAKQYN